MIRYDDKFVSRREHFTMPITKIMIDMSGWNNEKEDNLQLLKEGTYPYKLEFKDAKNVIHSVTSDGYKSGNFKQLMDDVGQRCGCIVDFYTQVEIIIPEHIMSEAHYDRGCISYCSVKELGESGMKALDASIVPQGKIQQRIQTCLDEIVHTAWYNCHTIDTPDHQLFPESVNKYSYAPEERMKLWPEYDY